MRFFLIGVLAGFLLANTSVVFAASMGKGCMCLRGYPGFSILLTFNKIEFIYVASGDTKEVAGSSAINSSLFLLLMTQNRFPKLYIFPFSVSTHGTQTADVAVNWETGVVTNKKTGEVDNSIKTNEKGNSSWLQVCSICEQKKHMPTENTPRAKSPFQYINFP